MLLYPSVNKLQEKTDSRYSLVILTAKRARDIIDGKPVLTEEEALAFVEEVRKKYYDARHHCFAYIIGNDGKTMRAASIFRIDLEPSTPYFSISACFAVSINSSTVSNPKFSDT